jgi:hypothetical protein
LFIDFPAIPVDGTCINAVSAGTAAAHLAFTGKFAKNGEATTSKTRQFCRYDRKEQQLAGIDFLYPVYGVHGNFRVRWMGAG